MTRLTSGSRWTVRLYVVVAREMAEHCRIVPRPFLPIFFGEDKEVALASFNPCCANASSQVEQNWANSLQRGQRQLSRLDPIWKSAGADIDALWAGASDEPVKAARLHAQAVRYLGYCGRVRV